MESLPEGSFYTLCNEQLQQLQNQINNNIFTKSQVAKHFGINRQTLEYQMNLKGFPLDKKKPGRISVEIPREVTELVMDKKETTGFGITKTYYSILSSSEDSDDGAPSYHTVRRIFDENKLYKYSAQDMPSHVGESRYEAAFPNMIWHVDIHFQNHKQSNPVYGIIDDFSRYIIALTPVKRKTATVCLSVLQESIEEFGAPFCLWSDNGGENLGEFHQYLVDNGIRHIRTRPHCPQQNGKIEKFWRTFEILNRNNSIEQIIEIYNNTPHIALPKVMVNQRQRPMTPKERFNQIAKYDGTQQAKWVVNGEEKDFDDVDID